MTSRAKVVKVRSWDELPEVVGPGEYIIRGRYIRVYREVDKDTLMRDLRKKLPSGHYI